MGKDAQTPMMKQYREIKSRHTDSILFFRLGDFYEMFCEDAHEGSKILGLTLTARGAGANKTPMCGVPFHAAESYISKLIRAGKKVAICEQVEDPKQAKGIVRRDVTQIFTPGTVLSSSLLEDKSNNYIAAVYGSDTDGCGLAFLDISTGKFMFTELESLAQLNNELLRLKPAEIIYSEFEPEESTLLKTLNSLPWTCLVQPTDSLFFDSDLAYKKLTGHFKTVSLEGFGCENKPRAYICAGAILAYLEKNKFSNPAHISTLSLYSNTNIMMIDSVTRANLAIEEDKNSQGSLISVLDQTLTSMGGRTLRDWIRNPLIEVGPVRARQDGAEEFVNDRFLMDDLRESMSGIKDIERILGRISCGFASPRDLLGLKNSLSLVPNIKTVLARAESSLIKDSCLKLHDLSEVVSLIESAIVEDPPATTRDGRFMKKGFHPELDEIIDLSTNGKTWLKNFQEREIEATGIKSLKVQYNKVFGYYIEITKSNLDQIPEDRYIRKQTLVNAERFISPELKEQEAKILGAEEKRKELELFLFKEVLQKVTQHSSKIKDTADALGVIDTLYALALAAIKNNYVRPFVNEDDKIEIEDGRHPIVETTLGDSKFEANDSRLDCTDNKVLIITGPNMAGKSTYIRQVALITLMAQTGSFVPAGKAHIGMVDRIFTRIGASDDLLKGRSTFLVEMNETALILNNATAKSLIILDEIGRGTSTFDGLSIAWAVVEYINNKIGAKTLFATHYHELTELSSMMKGVVNYNVKVREWEGGIIFVRKIEAGGSDKSYGIHVAQIAGLPNDVTSRAFEVLDNLESMNYGKNGVPAIGRSVDSKKNPGGQLSFFDMSAPKPKKEEKEHPAITKLKTLDPNAMTPIEALNILSELKKDI